MQNNIRRNLLIDRWETDKRKKQKHDKSERPSLILTRFNIQAWPMQPRRCVHLLREDFEINMFRCRGTGRKREDIAREEEADGRENAPPRPFRVTRLDIRSSAWFTFTITHLCLDPVSYYSLLTHSSRSWIIYHLDTPFGLCTAHCCSRGIAAAGRRPNGWPTFWKTDCPRLIMHWPL